MPEGNLLNYVVGAIVLGMIGLAFSMAGSDGTTKYLIYGLCTAAGAIVVAFVNIGFHFWREKREHAAIATALLVEVHAQASMVVGCGSFANARNVPQSPPLVRGEIDRFYPPEPTIYRALAPRIYQLPVMAGANVAAFHGAVQTARALGDHLGSREDYRNCSVAPAINALRTTDKQITARAALAWSSAAHFAVAAIKVLAPIAEDPGATERDKLDNLMERLAGVANGGSSLMDDSGMVK